jgi:hypothetical protein
MVAATLLKADVYASSLVSIAGAMSNSGQFSPALTVGITNAGNLEARIMSLLKRPEINSYQKSTLVIAALLILAVPCAAAAFLSPGIGMIGEPARTAVKTEPTPPVGDEAATGDQKAIDETREKLETALKEIQESDLNPPEKEAQVVKLKHELEMLQLRSMQLGAIDMDEGRRRLEEKMRDQEGRSTTADEEKREMEILVSELEKMKAAGTDTQQMKAQADELRAKLDALRSESANTPEAKALRDYEMAKKLEIERLAKIAQVKMEEAVKIAVSNQPGTVIAKGIDQIPGGEIAFRIFIKDAGGNVFVVVISSIDGRVITTELAR